MFYFFLTRFNEASRAGMFISNKIAGITTKKVQVAPTEEAAPTITITPTVILPSPTPSAKTVVKIAVGEIMVGEKAVNVFVIGNNPQATVFPTVETLHATSLPRQIPYADFDLRLDFPGKVSPGSADNKFIFENQEYEIKIFSQIGTHDGFDRENFFAEKTGKETKMLMYKFFDNNRIIITRETGFWSQGVQVAVGVGGSDEDVKQHVARFFVE